MKKLKSNLLFVSVILVTFLIAFLTSLLLEIPIFQHWVRYVLVVLLIVIELFSGFLTIKYLVKSNFGTNVPD